MNKRILLAGLTVLALTGLAFVLSAQTAPISFLKLRHEIAGPNITDQASFQAVRAVQDQVVTGVGGSPAEAVRHPVAGTPCWSCHPGTPSNVSAGFAAHNNVALNDTNPVAGCACHAGTGNLYNKLAGFPYFTELKFQLTDKASLQAAEAAIRKAVTTDVAVRDATAAVAKSSTAAKWEFELNRESPNNLWPMQSSYGFLMVDSEQALRSVLQAHTPDGVNPDKLEVRVEVKATNFGEVAPYQAEFGGLDVTVFNALPGAPLTRFDHLEGKWIPPIADAGVYTYTRNALGAVFGNPTTQTPERLEWNPPAVGGATAVIGADFKLSETKITFDNLEAAYEDEALNILSDIAAHFAAYSLNQAVYGHTYRLQSATAEQYQTLMNTIKAYKVSGLTLPDKGFKSEAKAFNGTTVVTDTLAFMDQKINDYSGQLTKTKTELKWWPTTPSRYEYKVEIVGADPQYTAPVGPQSPGPLPTPPAQYAKVLFEVGSPPINRRSDFFAARMLQQKVADGLGDGVGLHPYSDRNCWACHREPGNPAHSFIGLNESNPSATCTICHGIQNLGKVPYFGEAIFPLTGAASINAARAAVQKASDLSADLPYDPSSYKWSFELRADGQTLSRDLDPLMADTQTEMQALLAAGGFQTQAGKTQVEAKVMALATAFDPLSRYFVPFDQLDLTVQQALTPTVVIRGRMLEGKWRPPITDPQVYTYTKNLVSGIYGAPTQETVPTLIEWSPVPSLGVGKIAAEFKPDETKLKFENIPDENEPQALSVLKQMAAHYPNSPVWEAKYEHKWQLKNASVANEIRLAQTVQGYKAAALTDKEFKYEFHVWRDANPDLLTATLAFFDTKRADLAGQLVRTKTEIKWQTAVRNDFEYKVEIAGAQRGYQLFLPVVMKGP